MMGQISRSHAYKGVWYALERAIAAPNQPPAKNRLTFKNRVAERGELISLKTHKFRYFRFGIIGNLLQASSLRRSACGNLLLRLSIFVARALLELWELLDVRLHFSNSGSQPPWGETTLRGWRAY
ncbi:hypothetical protein TNCV_4436611 [Trichonephila clavipes]|nr:hypothetical protein TNCV_4436611 [Trichonephila clavipes]